MPDYARPNRAIASSPIPGPRHTPQPQASLVASVRQMRLKVLYTFDEDKTNCLARWPHALDIRTAYLDENTQVGVIELKTCIQAIATASPEIVARLGQDYTVYAYDYSEYETPLVGQGMLSWILASSSPTPGAPAHQSRTMVTGRVCRNTLGLFSSCSQETLEVKLRLVPVPTSLQSEYIESMKKYRDISHMMPPGFDPQAWTSFLQANPGFMRETLESRSQSPAIGTGQVDGFGIEHVQRLLNGDAQQPRPNERRQAVSRTNSFANAEVGHQLPRLPSPASSVASTATAPKRRGRKPGPNYKGPRTRRTSAKQASAPESADPGYGTSDERFEEGPLKKRAKVVQAEWDGKQDFGKQPESLRVAASTAASVRIHQPTAVRPGNKPHLSLDGQPRAPTPIANSSESQRPRLPLAKSNLSGHPLRADDTYAGPYSPAAADSDKQSPLVMSSPEKSQVESSPVDIASSPPVFPSNSTTQSSPRLPDFPPHSFEDSGFMSGTFSDLFEDHELRPLDNHDHARAAEYSKRPDNLAAVNKADSLSLSGALTDGQPSRLPEQDDQRASHAEEAVHKVAASRKIGRTASSGNLSVPPVPASDPIRPSTLNRSQTWSGNQAQYPHSDLNLTPPIDDTRERPISDGRGRKQCDMGGQSGVKRKAAIQSNLKASIAAGEVPPFCDNCGAIETPTWRKAWSKIHSGTPEHVRLSEEEGGILAWQTLQTDSKGIICLYRIIKKFLTKYDEGFTDILLCNPCGIWLYTRKCMRPKETWDKTQRGPDDKRRRRSSGKAPHPVETSHSGNIGTSSKRLQSDPSSAANIPGQSDAMEGELKLSVPEGRRASFSENHSPKKGNTLDEVSAAAALERAIQSSPHNCRGSKQVPIEVGDLTPQPTRRILFPSPTQSEQAKSKRNSISGICSLPTNSHSAQSSLVIKSIEADKENRPPPSDDDLDRFFDKDGYEAPARLITPTPAQSEHLLFETPVRSPKLPLPTTGDFLSSAARAFLHPPSTPKRTPSKQYGPLTELTPFTAHLNQLLSDSNAGSPGSNNNNFDFPTLPSLRNTPRSSRILDFDFTHFDSQDLVSTDVPMPSSPPAWNFGVYEDSAEPGAHEDLWADYTLGNTVTSREGSEERIVDGEKEEEQKNVRIKKVRLEAEAAA
ncbi:MAG: hypothetical protein Q9217_001752 [Psora testacea]